MAVRRDVSEDLEDESGAGADNIAAIPETNADHFNLQQNNFSSNIFLLQCSVHN